MKSNTGSSDTFTKFLPFVYAVLIPCAVYDLWWLLRPVGTVFVLSIMAYDTAMFLQRRLR